MCRNIKTLFNYDPPTTEEEIHASAVQFVRKISGFRVPSKANEAAFDKAVADITSVADQLLQTLETSAAPRNREMEVAKRKQQAARRFAQN